MDAPGSSTSYQKGPDWVGSLPPPLMGALGTPSLLGNRRSACRSAQTAVQNENLAEVP